jgi:hypothetical protein
MVLASAEEFANENGVRSTLARITSANLNPGRGHRQHIRNHSDGFVPFHEPFGVQRRPAVAGLRSFPGDKPLKQYVFPLIDLGMLCQRVVLAPAVQ